jgi:hypothetical protein
MKQPKISLHRLFLTLLSPLTSKEYAALPGDETVATTIRLEPEVRRYYEDAAKELGVSLQSIIKMSLTGLMKISQNETKTEINLMIDRFFETFATHGIPLVDIPKFLLPFKISLSALASHDRLLDELNTELLSHIATLFSINLKWLQGVSNSCVNVNTVHHWYKSPGSLCNYLNELSHKNLNPEVLFIANSSRQAMLDDRKNERYGANSSQVGILLKIPTQTASGISYTKFELCENNFWGYEKSRMDLKTVMMFCVQNHFDLRGITLKKDDFNNLFQQNILPMTIFKLAPSFWEPSDYVIAGYCGDEDTDELLAVVSYYCEYHEMRDLDGKGKSNRHSMWDKFALNLDNYVHGVTQSIEELFNSSTKHYNSKQLVNSA